MVMTQHYRGQAGPPPSYLCQSRYLTVREYASRSSRNQRMNHREGPWPQHVTHRTERPGCNDRNMVPVRRCWSTASGARMTE
eukprot:scaffold78917_cov33-Tisochrysis_lutea.AAC.2